MFLLIIIAYNIIGEKYKFSSLSFFFLSWLEMCSKRENFKTRHNNILVQNIVDYIFHAMTIYFYIPYLNENS